MNILHGVEDMSFFSIFISPRHILCLFARLSVSTFQILPGPNLLTFLHSFLKHFTHDSHLNSPPLYLFKSRFFFFPLCLLCSYTYLRSVSTVGRVFGNLFPSKQYSVEEGSDVLLPGCRWGSRYSDVTLALDMKQRKKTGKIKTSCFMSNGYALYYY